MPIRIPNQLPAKTILEKENIVAIPYERAEAQDIRPLRIAILNLMPTKIATETQILRLLGNSPLQVEIDLIQTATYTSKNTPSDHLLKFYSCFNDIKDNFYDGIIITGAPVEHLNFEEVVYWEELKTIFDWSDRHVFSQFNICWGAQAALYHYYGINKYKVEQKISGIFSHTVNNPGHPIVRGFDDVFMAPHSRHTETKLKDLKKCEDIQILSTSAEAGLYLAASADGRKIFVTGHSEYDRETLANEYLRDLHKGLPAEMPKNYFPNNDPDQSPPQSWRGHANLLYVNWLNFVYQTTPYNLEDLAQI